MAVNVRIDPIQSLEDLPDQRWKSFGKWNTCVRTISPMSARSEHSGSSGNTRTNSARKHGLVVDIALDPRHQVLHIFGRWHLRWTLEILRILPEEFKSGGFTYQHGRNDA